jgi:hypothetical protein
MEVQEHFCVNVLFDLLWEEKVTGFLLGLPAVWC